MAKSKKAVGEPIASVAKVEKVALDTTIAEDTLAAPRPSRKRTGEFFDFDGEDEDGHPNIATKGSQTNAVKSKKKPKIVPSSSDTTKLSKPESHPVEMSETDTGGVMVEVVSRRISRRDKSKGNKDETVIPIHLEHLKPAEKSSKRKKSKKDGLDTTVGGKEIVPELAVKITEPGVSESGAEVDKLSRVGKTSSKSKSKSKIPSKDDSTADVKILEQSGEDADKREQMPTETSKEPTKSTKGKSKGTGDGASKIHSKSNVSEDDHEKVVAKKSKETGDDAVRAKRSKEPGKKELKAKSVKSNKAPGNDKDEAAETAQSLPEKLQVTEPSAESEPQAFEARDNTESSTVTKSKKGKKRNDASDKKGGSKNTLADSSDVDAKEVKEAAERETNNPKKRKKSVGASKDVTEVIDHPDEERSAKENRKKAKHSTLGTAGHIIGDMLSAGLTTAAYGVNAVKDFATEVANGTGKSIMDDAAQIAEAVVESNENVEGLVKKSSNSDSKSKKKVKGVDKNVEDHSKKAAATHPSAGLKDDAAVEGDDIEELEEEEEEEENEQTLALLNGFDSGDEDQFSGEEIFKQGQSVPKIPKKSAKKLKSAKNESEEPGVVFVGHIPHGFYEHEMRAYFSQFGTITRIRLSRNRKTGRSKHYAFIEFESAEVAKIVADTMDKYLLFGHILKCKFAAPEKLHSEVWKGSNKRFKTVPWNKIEGRKLELPMGREGWEKRTEREKKRREGKSEKTKEIGYEYNGAQLKSVDEVAVREAPKEIEVEQATAEQIIEEEKSLIVEKGEQEGTIVISEETRTTRRRRSDKQDAKETVSDATAAEAKKVKKLKKAKATELELDQESPAIQNAVGLVRLSEAQSSDTVEKGKDAIHLWAASAPGEVGKTTAAVQEQVVPTLKKARRVRESLGDDSACSATKLKDNAGATVADGSHKMEESIQDAVADESKPKKAKRSKKAK